jgi:[acyl-carrier-protein] S-malonyltransferase
MGADVAERYEESAEVFRAADAALGLDLSKLCWHGPDEELRLTANTQPALLTHSIAVWRVLAGRGVTVEGVAGHSLGEYSAVVAAGGLTLEDAVRVVRRRGELMQAAVPVGDGAMAAVLGLDDETVVQACAEAEAYGVVAPVNFNAPGQLVIAGSREGVAAAVERARELGARRAVELPVSAPFHSSLMAPARKGLTPVLADCEMTDVSVPVYRNVDAMPVRSAEDVREGLVRQVDAPVRWADSVRRMVADGFDTFLEVGAGTVLRGLIRRIDRSVACHAVGTVDEIEKVLAELG